MPVALGLLLVLAALSASTQADEQWTILKPHGDRAATIERGVGDRWIIKSPSGERLDSIERGDKGKVEIDDCLDPLKGQKRFVVERAVGGHRWIIREEPQP